MKLKILFVFLGLFWTANLKANSSFAEKPNQIDCKMSFDELNRKANVKMESDGFSFFAGYSQKSKNNQDPVVIGFQSRKRIFCNDSIETSKDDGKAYGIYYSNGRLFISLTSTGTQGKPNFDYRRFTKNGWIKDYGKGGGAKVSVLLELEPGSGKPLRGSFLKAQKSDGKSNSFVITDLNLQSDGIEVQANSWFSPLGTNKKPMTCNGKSPFKIKYVLSSQLNEIRSAEAIGCE